MNYPLKSLASKVQPEYTTLWYGYSVWSWAFQGEAFVLLVRITVFKTAVGLNQVPGGFDSHPPPPLLLPAMKRIPQPPIAPGSRPTEDRSFWPGFVLAVVGLVLLLSGARHATGVDTVNGARAQETQLIKAFSSGGLQYASRIAPPPAPIITDQANAQELLQQWQDERANTPEPTWKVRVDTGASTPCPT